MRLPDTPRTLGRLLLAGTAALLPLLPAAAATARADLAVSANDNKVALVNGTVHVVENPTPDTATIIDLGVSPPKVLAEIPVPASVVGPPLSVAITPDEGLALVTAAMKVDPSDRTKQERNVQVLRWDGTALKDLGERIKVNGGSAALRTADKP